MNCSINRICTYYFVYFGLFFASAQTIDAPFSKKKMKIDLEVFKKIRETANSGIYKYQTKEKIDSLYHWADLEIEKSTTYLDFFNIITKLTDFEGSLHNETLLPEKQFKSLKNEKTGYFPYPIKWLDGKWIVNFKDGALPLGAEIISINNESIANIMQNLNPYFTTDGFNVTGKHIGMRKHFAKYYRWYYGLNDNFDVQFRPLNSNQIVNKQIGSVGYLMYYKNFSSRHSKPLDHVYYTQSNQKYHFSQINATSGILTLHTFALGNETEEEHHKYCNFLDSVFVLIKNRKIENLIVDVRQNGGGTDPNDLVTYAYLTDRDFKESKEVWISFNKIPYIQYYNTKIPKILRPFGVRKFNLWFQQRFPIIKDGKYFMGNHENEMRIRKPEENAFQGNVYLLISPAVASAGSLFAAMVASNENTIVIGEETMGGFYGHNGHSSLEYKLPHSKLVIVFSVENVTQDVPMLEKQIYGRGIIPDFEITQNLDDFIKNNDSQYEFVLKMIDSKIKN